jgi:hypothetical protein
LLQTGGTDDPVIVLGHTFPAVEAAAFWTAGNRLTHGVIETSLLKETGHETLKEWWRH